VSTLQEELALLDGARDALRSKAAARALRRLDEYDQRFQHPALRPEAQALRIEAYAHAGERARARSLFASFVRDQPGHPLVPHLSQLMAAALPEEPTLP
jgi:outer membrane protein assembly factor BamD (BamD/ComL family)